MNRREMLSRLLALPLAVKAAAKVPAIGQRIGHGVGALAGYVRASDTPIIIHSGESVITRSQVEPMQAVLLEAVERNQRGGVV